MKASFVCLVLAVAVMAAVPPPFPESNITPQSAQGTITTNPIFMIEWSVGLPNSKTVGIYDSMILPATNWRLLLTLSSEVLTNLLISIEPQTNGSRFYKWDVVK